MAFLFYFGPSSILVRAGEFLILDERPVRADAIVVLCSGVEYYPRLVEAANLYEKGFARKIAVNGNRKSATLRELEAKGFKTCCPWYENPVRILSMLGVPKKKIVHINAEDAYDTISEAVAVGNDLVRQGVKTIILTTSKFHSRRAHFIWTKIFDGKLAVYSVPAQKDPFDSKKWWKDGRQIRWVLSEYGAWVYYYWKKVKKDGILVELQQLL